MQFQTYAGEIRDYCVKNNLDFSKLKKMVRGSGQNDIIFQKYDPNEGKIGLLDETPMPVVLRVDRKPDGSLVFEQTEHTKKYL